MSTWCFSVNYGVFFIVVVVVISSTISQHSPTSTNLAISSLLVEEQASNSNNNADKEIAFISFNGNLFNGSKPQATTQHTAINDTIASATKPEPTLPLRRDKRYLDFIEDTRMFFRINIQTNVIPKQTIWVMGFGYRSNYPIENENRFRPFRRDTYNTLGDLMDKNGFDGKACILKAFCAAHMDENSAVNNGILFKLNEDDKRHFPYLKYENCHQILHSHCPLSFNNISPFTDDV